MNLLKIKSKSTKKIGMSIIKTSKGYYFEFSLGYRSWIWSF
jgi:hypothetical protein